MIVIIILNFRWSDTCSSCATPMIRRSMTTNHLIFRILWPTIWPTCWLYSLMSRIIPIVRNRHIHFVLYIIFICHLALITHMMSCYNCVVIALLLSNLTIVSAVILLVLTYFTSVINSITLLSTPWRYTLTLIFVAANLIIGSVLAIS
jgi:hypothetical protein